MSVTYVEPGGLLSGRVTVRIVIAAGERGISLVVNPSSELLADVIDLPLGGMQVCGPIVEGAHLRRLA